jgi:transcriptional repressor NrdR
MRCPYCDADSDRVVDSRPVREGKAVRRRRECTSCKRRFTTYEYVEPVSLQVVKSDGRREPFNRAKLETGLRLACKKRPVSEADIERIVDEIEDELQALNQGEVGSREVGERVMERLRELDEVAYVRFASVYRKFQDVQAFREELDKMLGE